MAVFPKAEGQILALARQVIHGLRESPEDFPKAPVPPDELQALLDEVQADVFAAAAAKAAYHEQHARKDKSLHRLKVALKASLRHAEIMARHDPTKLVGLGWGARRPRQALRPPGEVRDIRIVSEGATSLILAWKPPVDGGAVTAYTIQVKRNGTPWEDVGVTTKTRHEVRNQPRGVELEFRVYAVNKAGAGSPSATVRAVL